MKNFKLIIGIIISVVALVFSACHSEETAVERQSELVMAEESELALLMRQLTEETDSIRSAVLRGEGHPLWSRIKDLHTAVPTDATSSGPVFDGFASAFIAAVDEMEAANDSLKSEYFNGVINRCMDCHQEFCPGPMKRIRKFYVQE